METLRSIIESMSGKKDMIGKTVVFQGGNKQFAGKTATVVDVEQSGNLTIEFEGKKKLTEVPMADVRFVK